MDADLQAAYDAAKLAGHDNVMLDCIKQQDWRNSQAQVLTNQTAVINTQAAAASLMAQVAGPEEQRQELFMELVKVGAQAYYSMLAPSTSVGAYMVSQAISAGLQAAKQNYATAKNALDAIKAGNAP